MIIYEQQNRFNQYTGEPVNSILVESGTFVCDYCGKIIDDDSGLLADTNISIKPLGCAEAWFHEERNCLGDKYPKFDLYEFFEKQCDFHFCTYYNSGNCEKLLMMEWLSYDEGITISDDIKNCFEQVISGLGPLYETNRSIEEICAIFSQSRYRVLKNVLQSLKPEQLGIKFES